MERYRARKVGKNIALYRTNLSEKYGLPEGTSKKCRQTKHVYYTINLNTDVDVICKYKYKFLHASLIYIALCIFFSKISFGYIKNAEYTNRDTQCIAIVMLRVNV